MTPQIAVLMGSRSDWPTMKMATVLLDEFQVAYDVRIVSAHRSPELLASFAQQASSQGFSVIIAGAGGAAHLPGMLAAHTHLPVLGVPVQSRALNGIDSLLSIAQMPRGVSVGTMAIGESGAVNAALFAIQVLALQDQTLLEKLRAYRQAQTQVVLDYPDPREL